MSKHIFGPVPSRRLGISLGVDIIPYKTCTLDCVYCECGKTTNLTLQRQPFIPIDQIMTELKEVLANDQYIEYITFSGAGEPTLHSGIGHLINQIKQISKIPIAVLTNGTLLYKEDVRKDLMNADLVLPSLEAVTPSVFNKINRPHQDLKKEIIIEGITQFAKEYNGTIWLEVFLAGGINDNPDELSKIHNTIKQINPHKVQLNSLDRPPAYDGVQPVDHKTLDSILKQWHDLPVEIVKRIKKREDIPSFSKNLENNILNTIARRPLTIEDLEALTNKNKLELFKYIDILEKDKKIKPQIVGQKIFFAAV